MLFVKEVRSGNMKIKSIIFCKLQMPWLNFQHWQTLFAASKCCRQAGILCNSRVTNATQSSVKYRSNTSPISNCAWLSSFFSLEVNPSVTLPAAGRSEQHPFAEWTWAD